MDIERVKLFRDQFKQVSYTMWNRKTGEKKQFTPYIHICCDNSLNAIDDNNGSVIWDDDNAVFYWIRSHTPSSTPLSGQAGMSFGDHVKFPYLIIAVDYDEIQNIRQPMDQQCFDKFCELLGDKMTQEQKEYIENIILEEVNMKHVIARKREMNYVTGLPKAYDPPHKTEEQSYAHNIHSDQAGGV